MPELLCDDDPEPSERTPAGPLYVPVRPGPTGCATRLFRTPLGGRTAVAFTSVRRLAGTLGPDQQWIRLSEPALRALTAPLGVTALTVDPTLSAPAPVPAARAIPLPALRATEGSTR
ncbi:SAV_915 family protein [Streptomyces sp. NPDC020362]|uniref:SAV_915 family protein n=1 Tax=unclassified Streptomyces TaxID=2593676 RepID=UPI000A547386